METVGITYDEALEVGEEGEGQNRSLARRRGGLALGAKFNRSEIDSSSNEDGAGCFDSILLELACGDGLRDGQDRDEYSAGALVVGTDLKEESPSKPIQFLRHQGKGLQAFPVPSPRYFVPERLLRVQADPQFVGVILELRHLHDPHLNLRG